MSRRVDRPDHPEKRPGSVPRQPNHSRTPVAEPALRRYRGPTCQKVLESGKKCGGGATKASDHTRCPRHSDVPESEKTKWWLAGGLHATRVEGIPDATPVDLDTLPKITAFCALLATEGIRGRLHEARLIALDRVANTARLAIETAERIKHWQRLFGPKALRTPTVRISFSPDITALADLHHTGRSQPRVLELPARAPSEAEEILASRADATVAGQ